MTKHGHGLPRKKPGRSAKDEIEEELPALEPLDELPVLEPVLEAVDELPVLEPIEDEGPVKARVERGADGFDVVLAIDVPDMPKKDVAAAVEAPLARVAAQGGIRHRRVLVRFGGEGLIGSAVKDLVASTLQPHKPLLAVVRRGFGDEKLLEGALPTVELSTVEEGVELQVQIDTGECAAEDLPVAMEPHMAELADKARGRRVAMQFRGAGRPDAMMRDALAMALREAGARGAAIGARVLFDKDLEDRVRCSVSGNKATIAIALGGDDAETVDALSLVLPNHASELSGRNVRFQFARESSAVQAFCVDFAKNAGVTLVEVGGAEDSDIVWPPLIRLVSGEEVTLRLDANGRSRAAVLAAFARECAEHHTATQGKRVVVDWPAGFALDAEVEGAMAQVMNQLAPKKLACTIGGEQREPFVPAPVEVVVDGDRHTIRIDSEAGKPKELQRALDRRLPAALAGLRGHAVRIRIAGDVALSRTLVQSLCTSVAEAGAMRLEVEEGGRVDLLLPPMLGIVESEDRVKISVVADGRDADQQARAIARELEGIELALRPVTVSGSSGARAVADAALEAGASRVVLDGVQIHPPLFEEATKKGKEARLVAAPTGDAAMDGRMLDRELDARLKELGVLAGVAVTVVWPGAAAAQAPLARVLDALKQKSPAKVLLDNGSGAPVQVHPEPKPEPAPAAPAAPAAPVAPAAAAPAAAPAAASAAPVSPAAASAAGGLLNLLGRRDESVPPLVLLGVTAGDEEAHVAAVEAELQAHLPRFRGRAVLLIPQTAGQDAPARRQTALVAMLARVVPQGAAATLVFRGPDAQGRPHFQVLHSTLRAMPVGAAFGDPRSR